MAMDSLKTPLYDVHVERGARMVDFAGWLMPVQFTSINEEHIHTRTACSVFDVSHMGRLRLNGGDCQALLDRLCTRNLSGAEVGRCYYTHMCREDGGVLDDMIVSRFESFWGIVCNAANRSKILTWVTRHAAGTDVTVTDETMGTAMVAIQGPKTLELAKGIAPVDVSSLKRYHFRVLEFFGSPVTVYRTGYTGEDGFEVVVAAGLVGMLLPRLWGTKDRPHPLIRPAGLGARDTLRIEAAMPLYGHELTEDWDSLTAGQAWCVDLTKSFIGAEAMRERQQEGQPRQLAGLELDGRRIARQGYKVYQAGRDVGEITSGTLSPTLRKSIAMALISSDCTETGTELSVQIGRGHAEARVVPLPFYKRPS